MNKIGKYTFWIGLLLIVSGFITDIKFAGIPYQDPPMDLQIRYDQSQKIASWIMLSGLKVAVAGGLIWIASALSRLFRKEKDRKFKDQ